jgi:hypothetical protein
MLAVYTEDEFHGVPQAAAAAGDVDTTTASALVSVTAANAARIRSLDM